MDARTRAINERYGELYRLTLAMIRACTDMLDPEWSVLCRSPCETDVDLTDPHEVRVEFIDYEDGKCLVATVGTVPEEHGAAHFSVEIRYPEQRGSVLWCFTCTANGGEYVARFERHQVMIGAA